MFFRRPLIVLLGLGVLAGYGSALGHMRHRWGGQGPYGHDCGSWSRYEQEQQNVAPVVAPPVVQAPAPAPVQQQAPVIPQIIIVQPQAAAPATPAPTVIVQQPPAPQYVAPVAPVA